MFLDDHTLVTLEEQRGNPPSNYINASYVTVNFQIFEIQIRTVKLNCYIGQRPVRPLHRHPGPKTQHRRRLLEHDPGAERLRRRLSYERR